MVPLDVRNTGFMLARAARPAAVAELETSTTAWLFEPKWDGVRCHALVERAGVRLRGRGGGEITEKFPEVTRALSEMFDGREMMLDGELVCFDAVGVPRFPLVLRRDAQSKAAAIIRLAAAHPATLVVFDVLYDDEDCRNLPQRARTERVLAMDWPSRLCPTVSSPDGSGLWAMVERHNLEGLVAKAAHGRYRAGRTGGDWIKIKAKRSASVLVTGLDPTDALGRAFGALHMSVWDDDELVPVGRVGSGFSAAQMSEVVTLISTGAPLVIEVEYRNADTGTLREPVFKGVRRDVSPHACTRDQLELEGS